ncbi:DNA polymerase III subunit beta [Bacillus toyonensis]|jgi:DNA polymerase-3 subunit beta|uniref:Beta sliding clamp n=1 Tax=Bacillus toyonensis TaxID=155322 RepID=A0A2B6T0L5_9BACI|nr:MULTISPECIES: DNA polymerase III subunit beta [Bacillus]AFU13306.1 DNA polymerase III, beta subunit [Bacillus thuringiensis MC28]EEL22488.1 DNA polymerase III, beta subunit [Bacillus cereus Rock1-3]KNH38448.1 DNA polymerase III subunit beta [Bacillus thuringiensis]KXY14405.1 DNA polymerase III subunit beta [Bacillus cereus]MDH8705104.1 DNA polymerase-3 subunit beta [Stenotrophomonas sp. 1198]OTW76133.1 DNA polymerase III subunit beta [Bacillus thuringiensis serovar cameroun]
MEFIVNHKHITQALSEVSKAISTKVLIPILSGIKITADQSGITLIASNSNVFIKKFIPNSIEDEQIATILQAGTIVVPAKYFIEIIKKMPSDIVIKSKNEQIITIQSEEITLNLNGLPANEFPNVPLIEDHAEIQVETEQLIEVFKQTVFAVAKNESRPVLTGVHIELDHNKLVCAATDSHRLAIRETLISSDAKANCIVPSATISELLKLMNSHTEFVYIYLSDSHVIFTFGTTTLYSRLIEGKYPNISNLIPNEFQTVINVERKKILQGVDRSSLLASEWANNNVNLEIINESTIKISSNASQIGKIAETQQVDAIQGEKQLNISFDGRFMVDALRAITEEMVTLSFGGSMRPILIEAGEQSAAVHLISPVRAY